MSDSTAPRLTANWNSSVDSTNFFASAGVRRGSFAATGAGPAGDFGDGGAGSCCASAAAANAKTVARTECGRRRTVFTQGSYAIGSTRQGVDRSSLRHLAPSTNSAAFDVTSGQDGSPMSTYAACPYNVAPSNVGELGIVGDTYRVANNGIVSTMSGDTRR